MSDAYMKRVFNSNHGNYVSLNEWTFSVESNMQETVEKNINTLLGLEYLGKEIPIGDDRLDTVAFDDKSKCFVIIEYKNKENAHVVSQASAYLNEMKSHKGDVVLLYNQKKKAQKTIRNFDWNASYAIIISPNFTKYQIQSKNELQNIELHQISTYDGGVMILEQLNDTNRMQDTPKETRKQTNKPQTKPQQKSSQNNILELYDELTKRISEQGELTTQKQQKYYFGFYTKHQQLVCGIRKQQSKIKLFYKVKESDNVLTESNFVEKIDGLNHAGGQYHSYINDYDDIERVLPFVKKSYEFLTSV